MAVLKTKRYKQISFTAELSLEVRQISLAGDITQGSNLVTDGDNAYTPSVIVLAASDPDKGEIVLPVDAKQTQLIIQLLRLPV